MNLIQGSEEWLEFRQSKIGASDAPIILGDSPWKTPYGLWLEKMGIIKNKPNSAMRRGIDLEPIARKKFENEIGLKFRPKVVQHNKINYMIASLDGITEDLSSAVEIKCAGKTDHAYVMKKNEPPKKYYAQLQHQMEVCNLNKIYYYSFDGTNGFYCEVLRNQDFINHLIKKEEEFWWNLSSCISPPLIDKDKEFMLHNWYADITKAS